MFNLHSYNARRKVCYCSHNYDRNQFRATRITQPTNTTRKCYNSTQWSYIKLFSLVFISLLFFFNSFSAQPFSYYSSLVGCYTESRAVREQQNRRTIRSPGCNLRAPRYWIDTINLLYWMVAACVGWPRSPNASNHRPSRVNYHANIP